MTTPPRPVRAVADGQRRLIVTRGSDIKLRAAPPCPACGGPRDGRLRCWADACELRGLWDGKYASRSERQRALGR